VDAIRSDLLTGDAAEAPTVPRRTVLVVDDEELLRAALVRYFVRHGWVVLEAGDGQEALARLAAVPPPDVVIADKCMPRLDGFAFHAALAVRAPVLATRFILASGDPGAADVVAFRDRTGCTVVGKPFPLADLVALAEQVRRAPVRPERPCA
jgi:CheY-like chemotaxis protein